VKQHELKQYPGLNFIYLFIVKLHAHSVELEPRTSPSIFLQRE
jgi:hypothetical protein